MILYSRALSGIYMEKQPPRRAEISVRVTVGAFLRIWMHH